MSVVYVEAMQQGGSSPLEAMKSKLSCIAVAQTGRLLFAVMRRRHFAPFQTEHVLSHVTTVRSSDSKLTVTGTPPTFNTALHLPSRLSHTLTVCMQE